MAFRSKVSYVSALLAIAAAQAVHAGTIVDNTNGGKALLVAALPTAPQRTTALKSVGLSGNFIVEETFNIADGQQDYYFSNAGANGGLGVAAGPLSTTTSTSVIVGQTGLVNPYTLYAQAGTPTPATEFPQNSWKAFNTTTGAVVGSSARYFVSGVSSANWGQDAFLYLPATSSTSSSLTIIPDQGLLALTNLTPTLNAGTTSNGTVFYNQQVTLNNYFDGNLTTKVNKTELFRQIISVAVNTQNQVIGTANRYTGVASSFNPTVLGTDAWIYTPGAASPVTILGLTGNLATPTVNPNNWFKTVPSVGTGNYTYLNETSTPIAINSSGSVVGTSNRYQSQSANTSAGLDAWLYKTGGSSVQIGLTGTVPHATTTNTGSVNSVFSFGTPAQQSSSPVAINTNGTVVGTSLIYAAAGSTPLGQEAWVYTPSGAGSTATGYSTGTNAYNQLGLTTTPANQSAGTDSTKVVGYANPNGFHFSTVSALSITGNAVGLSTRYFTDTGSTNAGAGSDAYFYSPNSTPVNITPAASTTYSNYTTAAGLSTSSALSLNNGSSTTALVAGLQARYSSTGTSLGTDVFVYDASTQTSTVIVSPAVLDTLGADPSSPFHSYQQLGDFNSAENFATTLGGVTDAGEVYGYFAAYTGNASSTLIGNYLFNWTKTTGLTLLSSASTTAGADPLTSASAFTGLNVNGTPVYADTNGFIYGTGTSGGKNAVFVIPEPASLGLFSLGALLALRRRTKR